MSKYLKVEGHSDLVRDTESGAILNINTSELEQRRALKKIKKRERERIDNLEKDITEIKSLLTQLIEKS